MALDCDDRERRCDRFLGAFYLRSPVGTWGIRSLRHHLAALRFSAYQPDIIPCWFVARTKDQNGFCTVDRLFFEWVHVCNPRTSHSLSRNTIPDCDQGENTSFPLVTEAMSM